MPQMYSCSNKLALIHLTLFILFSMNLADTIRALKCLEQVKESVSLRLTGQPQHEPYLKALDNQRPLCFFDSFWECILEKRGLISKEPRETMGITETLHPQNTSKNSEAFSKGCLSDICHFGGQWKARRAALLC